MFAKGFSGEEEEDDEAKGLPPKKGFVDPPEVFCPGFTPKSDAPIFEAGFGGAGASSSLSTMGCAGCGLGSGTLLARTALNPLTLPSFLLHVFRLQPKR